MTEKTHHDGNIKTYHNKKCPICKMSLNLPKDALFICENCKYVGYVYYYDGKISHFQDAIFNPSSRKTISYEWMKEKIKNPSRRDSL